MTAAVSPWRGGGFLNMTTATFQDGANPPRTWTINLNAGLIESVLEATKVDLAPDDNDPSDVVSLLYSFRKLGAVLWACIEEQAKRCDVDRQSFFSALDGGTLHAGWVALVDAVIAFAAARSPKLAEQVNDVIESQLAVVAAHTEMITAHLKSPAFDKLLEDNMKDAGQRLQRELCEALTNAANGKKPEPPARLSRR
jgi:hypothetical protein